MKGVLMTKMVQELNLTNLTPEIDLTDKRLIMTAEIDSSWHCSLPDTWSILPMSGFRSSDM